MKHSLPFHPQRGMKWLVVFLGLLLCNTIIQGKSKAPTGVRNLAEFTVSGRVTDAETQEVLIGSTVLIKGTSQGVTTDINGNYSIAVPDQNAILVFEFVGYDKQEVLVGNQTKIDITLKSSALELSQVVVVGYGSTNKKDMTGSAKSIKNDDFNRGIINSPEQLLQGKVAGVNVTSATGEPGGRQSITIRGPGGVRTGSTPLFVLDGLALDNSGTGGNTNPLTFLNPQDIESIDVLKDASATAIYGSRGANGVVLITTKKGKSGFSGMTYTGSLGISGMANPLDLFTADEYRQEVAKVGGVLEDLGEDTDWQKEISRTAITRNHNLSLSGGANKLTYYGSFGLQQQEGILKGNDLNLYTGRLNISQKFLDDRLQVDVNLNATSTLNERPPIGGMIGSALSANPTYPAYDAATGLPYRYAAGTNPLITLGLEKDITTVNRVIGSITPSLTLAKGLVYKLNFGIDNATSTRDLQSLANAVPQQDGRLETITTLNRNRLIENYITYTFDNDVHGLTALAGHSYQKIFLQGRNSSINKFPISPIEPIYNPGLGQELTLANNRPGGYALINELQSFFGRVNYQFHDKYLLTATVRADGSSKFGENNKYGIFPSVSAGWRISEESFMKGGIFSDLKLRAGWGQTGNQEIPSKITQPLFTSTVSGTTSYPLADTGPFPAGTTFTRLANPDIQWEVSNQIDIGLDFALFNGALSGTIDYFNKVSNNILLEVIPADPVQPASSIWTNVENMEITNQGVELELNYRKRFANGFKFEVGGNVTFIDNIVENSPYTVIPSGSAQGSGLTSATINGYVNGQPIGTFFLREFTGFDDKGLSTYRDTDGDGVVSDKDRISAGSALPNRMYNFNTVFTFKGFDLRANFNGVAGNMVYDNTANTNFYKLRLSKGINTTREAILFANESVNNAAPVSTRYLKDGAFLRLNNLALNYTFNTEALGINKYVKGLNLSVTGQNLWLSTKYDGYDPEVNNDRSISGISSYGIDYLSYPRAKSVIFGLNVTF
ncbi:SusC/RagA family TonB-linked outer membrane protein [Haliscomenobacter hydrossis]|uniref:TonB-dependent receptor n=1 Tax=Haliscomenobacter hydrossis (strain ATCC 27775 / DSM 1100 / LMG 10767 / O) TaxID=760192 RepID=F4KVK6_HALH1|nr:TonB-dependent receptor [Haliscomenobacter hydrossis]AEE52463.1 TonB-dependent receptor [Haliscomenobacter hydrossis DSM 1100]